MEAAPSSTVTPTVHNYKAVCCISASEHKGYGVLVLAGIVNFLHSSLYGAMFWICDENSVDNTGTFSLLLSSAYTEPRPFLLLTPPHQRVGWGCT